ncbi:MAG: ABC transporter permease [Clostridiales bacterium]|nr:ABC transporter permease [Clostridiales bacterium]
MRSTAFAGRNAKELLRDPLTLIFGIGFPVVLITLISVMRRSIPDIPNAMFGIENFAPGMAVFGLSFLSLFLGILIAGDRDSSYLARIFASPMTPADYLWGYTLPLLPVAAAQGVVCFAYALLFDLKFTVNLLAAVLVLVPVSLLFIAVGILAGCTLTSRQVGGAASIVVNLAAWLSGTWFDLGMIGGAFERICRILPFSHAVDAVKAAVSGDFGAVWGHLGVTLLYAAVIYAAGAVLFGRRMKGE